MSGADDGVEMVDCSGEEPESEKSGVICPRILVDVTSGLQVILVCSR